jgi:hypothetical protein
MENVEPPEREVERELVGQAVAAPSLDEGDP